jgi:transcription elongation GreA/GreB family factor
MTDKAALRTELVAALEEALAAARAAHATAIEGATHPEAKAENDKDTRGLELSYLARGVAQRVADLEVAVADVTRLELRTFAAGAPIAMSALVTVDEDGEEQRFFVAPAGGGTMLSGNVQVVTTSSPLGRVLLGKRVDDDVELDLGKKKRAFVISAIR